MGIHLVARNILKTKFKTGGEMLPDKDYYRPDEVAKHYDVKVKTVYGWIAEGKLEAEKICGRTIRIPRESIRKMGEEINN